ncbi:hypothetical protein GCM10027347_59810 [Larkinella harenae]
MDFATACAEAASIPEFVNEYNRLTGNNLTFSIPKDPISIAIDKATGYKGFDENEMRKFAIFFYEYVWSRLPENCFKQEPRHD